MVYKGSQFYDDEQLLTKYLERRRWDENANDTIEKPVFMDLLGEVTDKDVLDLGCGTAGFGNELLDLGASSYTGIEGSKKMFELSKDIMTRNNGKVIHTAIEAWDFPASSYDMVVSRLVIHYINDIDALFDQVYNTLAQEGAFIFSVEHPVITSSYGTVKTEGLKQSWIVDQYFYTGPREQDWLGGKVIKYHRTIEDYFVGLQKAGFVIEGLRESKPQEKNFHNQETYHRRMKIPLFLFIKARKVLV
ncbi:class I SAM-dependent methyltransferase [Paenibacillus sp. VCA1]|uniref:class I SAM-dependent methyltransferase n=1 Tax=Paenibacillus sp. VCA1 TaxID=3039148 RepID=UPI00287143C5|nr:class I SAM-dependent methyltransferase [Paenibacillus sp. VCA1]MDR9856477.1 class I SAM-dependent methyltransferase [Paenibacillus sp. VCA1]